MILCGVPFKVENIEVMKCSSCKVTRRIKEFSRPAPRGDDEGRFGNRRADCTNHICNQCNYNPN